VALVALLHAVAARQLTPATATAAAIRTRPDRTLNITFSRSLDYR
jgi:hypothetical protein